MPRIPTGRKRGRPVGSTSKATKEVRQLAQRLFTPAYWQKKRQQLEAGELPPQIEVKMLAYAYGEPKQEKATGAGITINLGVITRNQPAISITSQPLDSPHGNDSPQTALAVVVNEAG